MLALGCRELHRQHIKNWQADDGWGSWVAAHAYKQNIMIVCYDNTVNGRKLADVDCGLDSACMPSADGKAGLVGWGELQGQGHHMLVERTTENVPSCSKLLQRKQVLKQWFRFLFFFSPRFYRDSLRWHSHFIKVTEGCCGCSFPAWIHSWLSEEFEWDANAELHSEWLNSDISLFHSTDCSKNWSLPPSFTVNVTNHILMRNKR